MRQIDPPAWILSRLTESCQRSEDHVWECFATALDDALAVDAN
jgi:hypothetical protein